MTTYAYRTATLVENADGTRYATGDLDALAAIGWEFVAVTGVEATSTYRRTHVLVRKPSELEAAAPKPVPTARVRGGASGVVLRFVATAANEAALDRAEDAACDERGEERSYGEMSMVILADYAVASDPAVSDFRRGESAVAYVRNTWRLHGPAAALRALADVRRGKKFDPASEAALLDLHKRLAR